MSKNKTKQIIANGASLEAYSDVVDLAELVEIRLISSGFQVLAEAYDGDQDQWKFSYSCEVESSKISENLILGAWVTGKVACKLGRKSIVSFNCKYVVAYNLRGKPDEAAADQFAKRVGAFAAYPYFRAQFAITTAQAGLALPPLPIMKEGKRRIPPAATVS